MIKRAAFNSRARAQMKRADAQVNCFAFVSLALLALTLAGCAHPTKVSESETRAFGVNAQGPVSITAQTVIVDARPAFEYSTAHIPHSVPLAWGDFTEAKPEQHGIVQRDTFGAARRLARAGVSPSTPVVVVGDGLKGHGEEGRVAWMLEYLGIQNVQVAQIDSLKPRLTNEVESQPPREQPIWKPEINESLNATRDEIQFAVNQNAFVKPASFNGAPPALYRFLDVRSERAYLGKEGIGAIKRVPNFESMNIPWQQFFTPQMRVNEKTMKTLRDMGVFAKNRIIVLDEDGIASAAATFALRAAGFANAANYAGGLQDLLP